VFIPFALTPHSGIIDPLKEERHPEGHLATNMQ